MPCSVTIAWLALVANWISSGMPAARVREALKEQGFGMLTEIDVQAALREKLGQEMEEYLILGACNPPLARRALAADISIGRLLACSADTHEKCP